MDLDAYIEKHGDRLREEIALDSRARQERGLAPHLVEGELLRRSIAEFTRDPVLQSRAWKDILDGAYEAAPRLPVATDDPVSHQSRQAGEEGDPQGTSEHDGEVWVAEHYRRGKLVDGHWRAAPGSGG